MGRAVIAPRRTTATTRAAGDTPQTLATRRRRLVIVGAAGAIVFLVGFIALLPRGYGALSERGYEFALAITSACNQRDEGRIARLVALIEHDDARRELDEAERGWLRAILAEATEGRWAVASRQARRLLEQQLR